jgi:transcriptional antiterminator NusG
MGKWFAIKVQSQKEDVIRENIEASIKAKGLWEGIVKNMLVPKESIKKVRGGKEKIYCKKLFPGYVLIEMLSDEAEFDEKLWYAIKETPGVSLLLGGEKPIPLSDAEAGRLSQLQEAGVTPKVKMEYMIGDTVKITDGPFENFEGKVEAINKQKGVVTVVLTIFGRDTKVEFEHWQIEKV